MGRIVDRHYIVKYLNQCYKDQENNCYFCLKTCFAYCKRAGELEHQLYIKRFNGRNSEVELWLVSYADPHKYTVLKPVLKRFVF